MWQEFLRIVFVTTNLVLEISDDGTSDDGNFIPLFERICLQDMYLQFNI